MSIDQRYVPDEPPHLPPHLTSCSPTPSAFFAFPPFIVVVVVAAAVVPPPPPPTTTTPSPNPTLTFLSVSRPSNSPIPYHATTATPNTPATQLNTNATIPLGVNPDGSGSLLVVAPCRFNKSAGSVWPAALPAVGIGVGWAWAQADRWEAGTLYREEEEEEGGEACFWRWRARGAY